MSDYAVKVTVRNGRILRRMREMGIKSQTELARIAGISITQVNAIVAIRRPGKRSDGDWSSDVWAISSALDCEPEELFTDSQAHGSLQKNSKEIEMAEPEVARLFCADNSQENVLIAGTVQRLLECVSDRAKRIMLERSNGATFQEIAEEEGISPARVGQIESKALRQMRAAYRKAEAFPELNPFGGRR